MTSYAGILLDDQLAKTGNSDNGLTHSGRAQGTIHFTSADAVIEIGEAIRRIPLNHLVIERGGAANRLLFFKNPHDNSFSFYTDNKKILKDPHLLKKGIHVPSVGWGCSGSLTSLMTAGFALIILLIVFMIWMRNPAVEWAASKIPVDTEKKLGALAWESLNPQTQMIKDSLLESQLQELVSPLIEGVGKTRFPLKFHISRDSVINAFALPGGYVAINAGLINKAESADEILGVVAHEIAHVEKQHSMRQIINTTGLILIVQTLLGDMSGMVALLTQQGAFLLQQSYSRDFEREADQIGLQYLTQSRVNPQGLVSFFEKIKKIQDESELKEVLDTEWFEFFSTHPSTNERIDILNEKIKAITPPAEGWNENLTVLVQLKERLRALK